MEYLEAKMGHLGAILGHLGGILGASGVSWRHLGASWRHLGAFWRHLGPSWAFLLKNIEKTIGFCRFLEIWEAAQGVESIAGDAHCRPGKTHIFLQNH